MILTFKPITVSQEAGADEAATVATCQCGHVEFLVFRVEGQQHAHLQCTACDVSYCFGGQCQ